MCPTRRGSASSSSAGCSGPASFLHRFRRLRDLTRYRKKLIQERAREAQRIQKLLEDAAIKLDSVVSDILGVSSRQMLEALIDGVRDAERLAQMAKASMRPKIPMLRLALKGWFSTHHGLMTRLHLDHIDQLTSSIRELDSEIDKVTAPVDEQVRSSPPFPASGSALPRWSSLRSAST